MIKHSQLVKEAAQWLRSTRGCMVVVSEMHCVNSLEYPDVIGWKGVGSSILVECKTSLADFRADKEKAHRQFEGMGQERLFYAPKGIIPYGDLPVGWGLIERQEITGRHIIRSAMRAPLRPVTVNMLANENRILISATYRALEAVSLVKPLTISDVQEILI